MSQMATNTKRIGNFIISYILIQKVVQSLSQTLPGQMKKRETQDLMKVQQCIPHT